MAPFDPRTLATGPLAPPLPAEGEPNLGPHVRKLVMLSGGKDSVACLLHLLERGVPPEDMELWHHDVDGREGSDLMDWPCTRGYCEQIAKAFGIPLYFSWKEGGFEREMLRDNDPTAAILFETPEGTVERVGGTSKKTGTRRKFPQVTANLSQRYCSGYLKIDVAAAAIRNQPRFRQSQTLVITGERAEEGKIGRDGKPQGRAAYKTFEPHRTDKRASERLGRHVDHWRPVHKWTEAEVWAIMERWNVKPHPAYRLGWGRVSCAACIFGSPRQWASLQQIAPQRFERIASYEEEFGLTIHRKKSVRELAVLGQPYERTVTDPELVALAMDPNYAEELIVPEGEWELPAGAFGESCGPT